MGMAMHLCMPVCAHNWMQAPARNDVCRRACMCAYAHMHMYGCMHMRLEKRDLYDWKKKDDKNVIFIIGKKEYDKNAIFIIGKRNYQKLFFFNRKKKDYQKLQKRRSMPSGPLQIENN